MRNHSNIARVTSSKRYVDDKKLTDHHAITVTDVAVGRKKLTEAEWKVYHLICKRLLAIFLPAYQFDKTTIILQSGGELFKQTGNRIVEKGYTVLYETFRRKGELPLPLLKVDDILPIKELNILSKMTEPPSRYTDSTLLDAMFHAGRFIEDAELQKILKDAEGIGTSATRAEIIEKLITIGMLERQGKSLAATNFGIDVIASLGNHDVVSPILTAIWSKKLKDIVDGQLNASAFYKEMLAFVEETTARMKALEMQVAEKEIVVVGSCPLCRNAVVEGFRAYTCQNKACKFAISKVLMKGKVTAIDAKKLLSGKETREIRFTWKSGKKGKARLKLQGEKLEFVF